MAHPMNERYRQYLAAERTILLGGQSYKIGNRTLTRADLSQIQAEIKRLQALGAQENDDDPAAAGHQRARRVLFRD